MAGWALGLGFGLMVGWALGLGLTGLMVGWALGWALELQRLEGVMAPPSWRGR